MPARRRTTLLSFTGLAWGPGALLESLRGEAALWQQVGAQLLGRVLLHGRSKALRRTLCTSFSHLTKPCSFHWHTGG